MVNPHGLLPTFGSFMIVAYLSLLSFLPFLMLTLVFLELRHRNLVGPTGGNEQADSAIDPGLRVSSRSDAGSLAYSAFRNGWKRVITSSKRERAENYLRRILALTGAAALGNGYVLDIGATRFHVRAGRVGQMRDLNDPDCPYKETCFYLPNKDMPRDEQVATALLQLANNPSLFERWAAQDGLKIKPDGQAFPSVVE
jgi:hypothetical protein